MSPPTQTWTEQITAHLELLNQLASRLPANERLEIANLERIIELNLSFLTLFLFQLELQGIKTTNM